MILRYSWIDDFLEDQLELTDDVKALFEEYSALPNVTIARPLCPQEHGMLEFDVMDLNGHRLVFAQPISAR